MVGPVAVVVLTLAAAAAEAPSYQPSPQELKQIQAKTDELATALQRLAARHADPDLLLDVEIYHKAAAWILRYPEEEFYTKKYVDDALTALDHGLARAAELAARRPVWPKQKGLLVRAYRSQLDDSVQPYALQIPAGYDGRKPVRLDVVLHGRAMKMNEVNFIAARDTGKPAAPELEHIQLDVFGRGNNAFRWAGETDVFEAIASVKKRYKIDPKRVVLRGFSMGGAGAWGLGLHYPDRWAAVEAGAGFSDTKKFLNLESVPEPQESTLHIYDSFEYALNAFNVPTVGYGGEIDKQLQSAVNVREQLTQDGISFTQDGLNWLTKDIAAVFLVGPQTAHKFEPASKQRSEQFIQAHLPRKATEPDHIRFVTYTTRYNECFWIKVGALEQHYRRADVDARRTPNGQQVDITTKNVAQLLLPGKMAAAAITIDGKPVATKSPGKPGSELMLEKTAAGWAMANADATGSLRKTHALQGPIDDAFLEPFLCVRPTGKPQHAAAGDYGKAALDRWTREFARWLHGTARVKDDTQVTPADMAAQHLVLFGDPGSNKILGQIVAKLPIRWTAESITVGGKAYPAADHALVMIYPNPLNPSRYVVINSGHTFYEAEFRGNNALVYPRLGDFAVLKLEAGKPPLEVTVEQFGLFGERWELPPQGKP